MEGVRLFGLDALGECFYWRIIHGSPSLMYIRYLNISELSALLDGTRMLAQCNTVFASHQVRLRTS